jgi:hypothetical protein
MDKYLGTIIKYIGILLVLAFVGTATYILYENRGFFKTFFDRESGKIDVTRIEKVDSLMKEISLRDTIINVFSKEYDSINTELGRAYLVQTNLESQLDIQKKGYETTILNLNNVIKMQNSMIESLKK